MLLFALLLFITNTLFAQSVIINEFSQGNGGTKEWIELLVVENNTDLRGMQIGDNDDGTFSSALTFADNADLSGVPAGALIVIYNAGDMDDVITAEDLDYTDFNMIIASENSTYLSGSWGNLSNSDDDDTPAIADASGNIIHDVGVSHTGGDNSTITSIGGSTAKAFIGASLTDLVQEVNWSELDAANATPGQANGGNNTTWITTLRQSSTSSVDNPKGLWATVASPTQIDLSWTKNDNADDVMVAYSADGTFGTPQSSTLTIGNTIDGGGIVLYNGANTSYSMSSLVAGVTYYFKAWSVNGSELSTGITAEAYITKPEPTNHVTGLSATGGKYKIDLAWTEPTTGDLPDGYLLKFSTNNYGDISAPVDGTSENDLDLSDGTLAFMVPKGYTGYTFKGLPPNTTLYVKVYPYSNYNDAVDYKTDETIPQADATVNAAPAQDIFISEYCEGSNSNKYIEIYNPTDAAINLSDYKVTITNNGSDWDNKDYEFGDVELASKAVFIIANSSASTTIAEKADAFDDVTWFNGDDAVAIKCNGYVIDQIGVAGNDPGSGWDVAGVTNATNEHTLVRKKTVTTGNTNWSASAGTNETDSEWEVYPQDTFDYLGYFGTNSDAKLASISVNGDALANFSADVMIYSFEFPKGTTAIPTVTATTNHNLATASITQVTNLTGTETERTATITVTAEDETTTKEYKIVFSVSTVLSDDASLSALNVDGNAIDNFDAATLLYTFEIPRTVISTPVVTVDATHPNATTTVTPATDIDGDHAARTTTILVEAEDGTTTQTYKVTFNRQPVISIYDIQHSIFTSGDSPKNNEVVTTKGVVTAKYEAQYDSWVVIQDGAGEWNGLWLRTNGGTVPAGLAIGDMVYATGTVTETGGHYSLDNITRLEDVTISIVSSDNALPAATVIGAGEIDAEKYEGVLVALNQVEYTGNVSYGEYEFTDATGNGLVHNMGISLDPATGSIYNVEGVVFYAYDKFKLEPRIADDFEEYIIDDATLQAISINGMPLIGFQSDVMVYSFELPFGTTQTPVVTATTTDKDANVSTIVAPTDLNGTELERTATIDVVAEDGTTQAQYKIVFNIADFISSDALLSSIKVDDVDMTGFDATDMIYTFTVEAITEATPTVSAMPNHAAATVVISQATSLTGDLAARTATIDVTAQDGTTTASYSVIFEKKALVTIHDIQNADGDSPYKGEIVTTQGIVTGKFTNSGSKYFTIQDGAGQWNGLWVFTPNGFDFSGISLGDEIMINGLIDEYYDLTNLKEFTFKVLSSGNSLPAASVISTADANSEAYEGVLVQVEGECVEAANNYGEWKINDGSGDFMGDDMAYDFEPDLGSGYRITGITFYSFGNYKIQPRDAADIVRIIGTDATLADIKVDGTSVDNFATTTTTYNVLLPVGTTEIPTVTVETTHPAATATVTAAANLTGTEAERSAVIDVVAEDGTTATTYTVVFEVDTDMDAPIFAATYPKADNIALTTADIELKMNEAGTVYYIVQLASETAPTLAEILASSETFTVAEGSTVYTISLDGLTSGTDYVVYMAAEDDEATPNRQTAITEVTFTTDEDNSISRNDLTGFSMYPNPAVSMLNIESNQQIQKLEVISIVGKLVISKNISTISTKVDVSGLQTGVYLLRVVDINDNISTKRFVKK